MLSAAVLGYQVMIIISLLIARILGMILKKPDLLSWIACAWTVFTFAFVFTSPLLVLQLGVIWGVTYVIYPRDKIKIDDLE